MSFDNKCRSIIGTDGVIYQNELCLNENSVAYKDLIKMTLTDLDRDIINIYQEIVKIAKTKEEYNYNLQYGVWQIDTDININWKDENDNRIYKYPELNGHIATLKVKLKKYYKDNICNSLFKYELIK